MDEDGRIYHNNHQISVSFPEYLSTLAGSMSVGLGLGLLQTLAMGMEMVTFMSKFTLPSRGGSGLDIVSG